MSEPSPEAKQAAEAKGYRQDKGYEYGAFIEGYDSATAKVRELLEETRRERDTVNEDYHHLQIDHDKLWDEAAKAREELEATKQQLLNRESRWQEAEAQLAHQQPSATGHECPFCGALGVLLNLLNNHAFPRRNKVWVQCNGCGARGPKFDYYSGNRKGEELAWEAWKKRNVFVGQPSEQCPMCDQLPAAHKEKCQQPSAPTADDSWCGCTNQNRDPKCKIHN